MKRPLSETETFRAHELLLLRATEGLDDQQTAELAALGVEDDITFELAATAVDLATLQVEALPAQLAEKLLKDVGVGLVKETATALMPDNAEGMKSHARRETLAATERRDDAASSRPQSRRLVRYAMMAAVAALLIAVGAVLWATQRAPEIVEREKVVEVPAPVPRKPTPAEARAELLATAKDVSTLPWQATKDPTGAGASGDVVWSPSAQRGFMRFKGLAPNDAAVLQYQLWIFDKTRDQAFPVDGGLFDVSSAGEVIIPITARLEIREPVLFAVTIEKPGGVVVSKRERIVVTAAPKT